MDFQVNTFKNCRSPRVESTVDFSKVLQEIQTGESYGYVITKARDFGKGSPEFEEIKVGKVPTYTVNATFDQKRNKDFISATTGYLYLDVDGDTEVDLSNPYIYSTYRSISGTGRGIVVKVNGLTLENLKWTYRYAGDLIGVNPDPSCADITRQVIMSFDPHLMINTESEAIDVSRFHPEGTGSLGFYSSSLPYKGKTTKRYIKLPPEKKEKRSSSLLSHLPTNKLPIQKLRFNNLDTYQIDGFYQLFEEKEPIVEVYIPEVIYSGSRYRTISLLINNLCYLNPFLNESRIYGLLHRINQRCEEELPKKELMRICSDIVHKKYKGEIEPICTKERKIIFHTDCPKPVRRKMMGIASGLVRSKNTLDKISYALDDWDLNAGKITNNKLAEAAGVHINTVKKYLRVYEHLRNQKEQINSSIISN